MAGSDPWKRYLDAGMELTNLTRDRAEKIVKEFVKAGEVQREQAQARVDDLLERSRKVSTALADTVRVEVTRQLTELGLINAKPADGPAAGTAKKASASAKKAPAAAKKPTAAAKTTAKKASGAVKKKATGAS